jgi:sarcosine oxidase
MGLPTARALAQAGHEVTVLDRYGVGNRWSSSSGATRIWRYVDHDPDLVRLAFEMDAAWDHLEAQAGRPLREHQGVVARGLLADAARAAMVAVGGVRYEEVGPRRLAELFPEAAPRDTLTLWQPRSGIVLAAAALAAEADLLVRAGGRLRTGVEVQAIASRSGGGVVVHTDSGDHVVDVAVVAAGPWAGRFAAELGLAVDLEPVVAQVSYFRFDGPWRSRPVLMDDIGDPRQDFYALPTPGVGYKVGVDLPVHPWADGDLDREPRPANDDAAVAVVRRWLPGFDPTVVASDVCTWTESPDGRFVLGRFGDVVIGCGDSGGAFKWLPMFGEWLGGLALGRELIGSAQVFDAHRFG